MIPKTPSEVILQVTSNLSDVSDLPDVLMLRVFLKTSYKGIDSHNKFFLHEGH